MQLLKVLPIVLIIFVSGCIAQVNETTTQPQEQVTPPTQEQPEEKQPVPEAPTQPTEGTLQGKVTQEQPPSLPTIKEFTMDYDESGYYINNQKIPSIAVKNGDLVKITFNVRATNVYPGGAEFRGCGSTSTAVPPGGITSMQFTASKDVQLLSGNKTQILVADMRAVSQYQFAMTAGAMEADLRDLVVRVTAAPPQESWQASLTVGAVSQGQIAPGGITLVFGAQQGATEGFDSGVDNPAPPPPAASTNIQPFYHYPNNPPGPPDTRRLQTSIIPPTTTNEWPLRVFFQATEGATTNVTLMWSLASIPASTCTTTAYWPGTNIAKVSLQVVVS